MQIFTWVFLLVSAQPLPAEALVEERFQVGQGWKVKSRSEISGTLHLPAPGGKSTRSLLVNGESALEYEEAILAMGDGGGVNRSVRLYKRADLKRKMGDQNQSSGIRQQVRKVVVVRQGSQEVPFSPDGPLTLNEIEMVRTDLFTPALAGLLPGKVVAPGASWEAKPEALRELTDLVRVDEGKLECTLAEFQNIQNQQVARIRFSGKVTGANQDGPCTQELDGQAYFDLNSKHLAYLSLNGKHMLPGGVGYPASTLQGRFVLTRERLEGPGELGAVQPGDSKFEPGEDNTLLVEELPNLRLEFPRRWKFIQGGARQITLDGADGSGVLITLEPAGRVPAAAVYQAESRTFLEKGGHRVVGGETPQMLSAEVARFTLEVEKDGKRIHLEYYVRNTQLGGILLAARFPGDFRNARPDLERLVRRTVITSPIK